MTLQKISKNSNFSKNIKKLYFLNWELEHDLQNPRIEGLPDKVVYILHGASHIRRLRRRCAAALLRSSAAKRL